MNRRDFVLGATTVASAGMSAASYARILGSNDRVSLGVIGLGRRGTIVAGAFLQDARVRTAAVSDIYDAQTALFLSRLPKGHAQPKAFVAYEELLAQKDVDAVLIAVPDHLHVQAADHALEAGKHVYLEKPTLHRWSERAILENTAKEHKLVLQCGMQQRSGSHYLRAKQEIFAAQKLGKVLFARAVWHNFPWQQRKINNAPQPAGLDWNRFLGPAPRVPYETARYTAWRYFPDYGNGLLADILTHWSDVAQWMLDDSQPLQASALGGIYQLHDGRQNPDTVSAVIQYDGWNLNFESSVLSIRDDRPTVVFEGTEGTLDLAREGYTFTPKNGEPVSVAPTESLERAHTANFLDAVLEGRAVNAPLRAGIDASRPVQLALRSYWTHKVVSAAELA
ncbi:MAG: Gfo/Idh/MocA family oxidoreductase [Terracidiphilus sp.]|nr:Gfo/Idh/MocA family oxidoreductase [Terracidiphilus sp.]